MKNLLFKICPILLISMVSCSKKTPVMPDFKPLVVPPKTYSFDTTVAWGDEFSADGAPDPAKWQYDTGGGGFGNNELEYYTNTTNNAYIKNGMLNITAKKESMGGMNYTSSRMASKFNPDMLYGRIEARIKIPAGRGTWPAFWMLPNDYAYGSWPASGEVDIMEHVGYDPGNVHFSVHTQLNNGGNSKSSTLNIPTAMSDYHLYREDWTPDAIKGYYDDKLVFTYTNNGAGFQGWPFDKAFHIMLNLAIGGNWGGIQGVDDTIFPVTMQVDYVHYYKMITTTGN
jgi:beta-glucanase (GH16 family)